MEERSFSPGVVSHEYSFLGSHLGLWLGARRAGTGWRVAVATRVLPTPPIGRGGRRVRSAAGRPS